MKLASFYRRLCYSKLKPLWFLLYSFSSASVSASSDRIGGANPILIADESGLPAVAGRNSRIILPVAVDVVGVDRAQIINMLVLRCKDE